MVYKSVVFMFSHYKNTTIGIAPNGVGILFGDIYPRSRSDSEISEKSRVLQSLTVFLDKPKQKISSQFT